MKTIWKPIVGWEDSYIISNKGDVVSLERLSDGHRNKKKPYEMV